MQIVYTSTHFKGAIYSSIVAILLGTVLVVWPGVALQYVIMLVGLLFLLTGLFAFIISTKNREERRKSLIPFSGIGSIALGILLISFSESFVTFFMFILGFILVLAAIGQLVTLVAAKQFGAFSPMNYLFPALILVAGIVVLFDPFSSAKSVFILFGATAIFYGFTNLWYQLSIKKMKRNAERKGEAVQMNENHSNVEDVEYEEIQEEK